MELAAALNTPSSHVPSTIGEGSNCPSTPTPRDDRVVINVGGTKHETFFSSLRSIPDTRLYWMTEQHGQCPEYDSFKQEYFFDRHPGLFVYVLNFYRTGKLHCPSDICGPLFEEELIFWGIDESVVEPCCWMNFKKHREAQVNLNTFEPYEEENKEEYSKIDLEASPGEVSDSEIAYTKPLKIRTCQALKNYQQKIWIALEEPNSSFVAQVIGFISMSLIILSVTNFCLETLPYFSDMKSTQRKALGLMEMICIIWFTVEFLIRCITSPSKWQFFKSPMNWIDFGAILPFFLEMTLITNVKTIVVLRVVRLIRVFRIFKLSRHSCGLQILGHTLRSSCRELFLLFFFLSIGVVIFSSLVFYAEKDVAGTKFYSIPDAFWWSIVTMTTIGYGDVVPESVPGKCVGIMCALCGVLVIALPIPVIVSNFSLYYSHAQAKLRASTRRKRPALSSAAHALRIARPWGFTTANIKNSKSDLNSEMSDTYGNLPRRSMVPSPTTSIRNNGQSCGRLPMNRSISQSPMLSPMNSRTTTFRSVKSNHFPVRQSSCEKSPKQSAFPELQSFGKQNLSNEGDVTQSPATIHKWRLQVSKSPMEFNSPSINISPPSTPSRSPASHLSYVSSPSGADKIDHNIFTNDQGELIPPVDSGIATKGAPTLNGTPNSHYLPSSRAGNSRGAESYSSSGTSTSTGLSPRGRTGRRNGIFLAGFATKKWQTKAGIRQRHSDTRNPMIDFISKPQSSSSRHSQSSDSVFAMLDTEVNDQHESITRPSSPGMSRTLSEVSKRLIEFATDPTENISSLEIQKKSITNDDLITANHLKGQERCNNESDISNDRLPLWMQASRNEKMAKDSGSFQLLDIEGAELFQRRRSKFSKSPAQLTCRKASPNIDQIEFLEGELSPILESNSSGKSSRGDPTRSNLGQSNDGSFDSPTTPCNGLRSSRPHSSCLSLGTISSHLTDQCTITKVNSAPFLRFNDHDTEVMHRSRSLPDDQVKKASEVQRPIRCRSKEKLCKKSQTNNKETKNKQCKFQLKNVKELKRRERNNNATPLIRVVSDCGMEQIPLSPRLSTTNNFDQMIESSLVGNCDTNFNSYQYCNQTRCLINGQKYSEIRARPVDTSSI